MPRYNNNYKPSAPTAVVEIATVHAHLIGGGGNVSVQVDMIIDTGADISCIPKNIVKRLEGQVGKKFPYDVRKVEDFNGKQDILSVYTLKLQPQLQGMIGNGNDYEFLSINQNEGILGRNVLNDYFFHLNGPQEVWTL